MAIGLPSNLSLIQFLEEPAVLSGHAGLRACGEESEKETETETETEDSRAAPAWLTADSFEYVSFCLQRGEAS